jgi:hypothetical protein
MAKALPLEGIRVANFGWVWAGPVVGQTLAAASATRTAASRTTPAGPATAA